MKIFTIENHTNNITLHGSIQEAEAAPNAERFHNLAGLAKLAGDWPAARLVEIWNSLPATIEVKKFKDRATAVSRIWKAIQNFGPSAESAAEQPVSVPELVPTEAQIEQAPVLSLVIAPESPEDEIAAPITALAAEVAPKETLAKTSRKQKVPRAVSAVKVREGSKTEVILGMMRQPGGTTLKAVMEASGWQAHSVRGFISGTLNKKMGLTVVSAKGDGGNRNYSVGV